MILNVFIQLMPSGNNVILQIYIIQIFNFIYFMSKIDKINGIRKK